MLVELVVAGLSVVQSLFGVGLLVFGTPTLLLMGHSFAGALAILLPASITISLLQTWQAGPQDYAFVKSFATFCLGPLAVSLALVLLLDLNASLNLFVAALLVVFVSLRLYPAAQQRARTWVSRHPKVWLVSMGVVHGVSNLGGALLLIFAATRFERKEDIRKLIAFCYASFAGIQLLVLALVEPDMFGWQQAGYVAIAGFVFLAIGQRVFRWVSAPVFDRLLTLVAAAYAGLLCLRSAGAF
jgi:uncharacterized membrane protein YfcA